MTLYILTVSTLSLAGAFAAAGAHDSQKRNGGLTFFRVGRFGGSFFVSRGAK